MTSATPTLHSKIRTAILDNRKPGANFFTKNLLTDLLSPAERARITYEQVRTEFYELERMLVKTGHDAVYERRLAEMREYETICLDVMMDFLLDVNGKWPKDAMKSHVLLDVLEKIYSRRAAKVAELVAMAAHDPDVRNRGKRLVEVKKSLLPVTDSYETPSRSEGLLSLFEPR